MVPQRQILSSKSFSMDDPHFRILFVVFPTFHFCTPEVAADSDGREGLTEGIIGKASLLPLSLTTFPSCCSFSTGYSWASSDSRRATREFEGVLYGVGSC